MERLKNIGWLILGLLIIGYVVYKIAVNSFTESFLGDNHQSVTVVIIDKRNYLPNQPVKAKFTYSYQFSVGGKKYTGDSHDTSLKVGDSIEVEYNTEHPVINKPLHRND